MAIKYVRSTDGNDADDGSTWALADATLAASLTASGAGGTSYVSQSHAETQASAMTLTSAGTAASRQRVICGNDAAEPPTAVASTATVSTTGANAIGIAAGYCSVYGVIFQAGSAANTANINAVTAASDWFFDTCGWTLNNTSSLSLFRMGNGVSNTRLVFKSCTFTFGHVGQGIRIDGPHQYFYGCTLAGSAPTVLVKTVASTRGVQRWQGCDLSLMGSGTSLVDVSMASSTYAIEFYDCKLGSSVGITTGSWVGPNTGYVLLVNSDSADTVNRYFLGSYAGTTVSETTIVRTGGSTTSYKMVSSANTTFNTPLTAFPHGKGIEVYLEEGVSQTVTVEVVTDGVTLTDAEAWIELLYLGTASFPLGVFTSDRAADILATPANQTSSSETWTTTGLSSPVKQKLSVTVTPQASGRAVVQVCLAKASTTMYVDGKAVVS